MAHTRRHLFQDSLNLSGVRWLRQVVVESCRCGAPYPAHSDLALPHCRDGPRQANRELGAPPWAFTLRLDGSAMHLHQLSGQRQADAQTALAPISIISLPEHVEDGPQRLAVDSDPVVDHAYGDACLVGGRLESYASALRRVLGAVVEQVGDRLRDPCGIS